MIAQDQDWRPDESEGRSEELAAPGREAAEDAAEARSGLDEVSEHIRAQMEEAAKWLTD